MLKTFIKWIGLSAFLAVLFRGSARECAVLLLAAWTIAVAVSVYLDMVERFLWIPMLLALAGVFDCFGVLSFPNRVNLAANEVTLVMFIVSLVVLRKHPAPSSGLMHSTTSLT